MYNSKTFPAHIGRNYCEHARNNGGHCATCRPPVVPRILKPGQGTELCQAFQQYRREQSKFKNFEPK